MTLHAPLQSDHTLVYASAGTGKTSRLTRRIAQLLTSGVPAKRIVATTFTRQAAREITRRVLEELLRLSREGNAEALAALSELTRAPDALNIGTIDSLLARWARGFWAELGIPALWRPADTDEEAALRREAILETLEALPPAEAESLVRDLHGGASSPSVLPAIDRLLDEGSPLLSASGVSAWEWDLPACEQEAEEAIRALRACEVPRTKSGTPRVKWERSLNQACEAAARGRWEDVLACGLMGAIAAGDQAFDGVPIDQALRRAAGPLLAHAARALLAPWGARTLAARSVLAAYEQRRAALQRERGVYAFDDIPALLARTWQGHPGLAQDLAYRLDGRLDHVLIDEFQDTSLTQWAALRPVIDEIVSYADGSRSLLAVGDAKQSLYGWRRAEPGLMGELPKLWPQLASSVLSENYRSSPEIIAAVNAVFGSLPTNPALSRPGDAAAAGDWLESFAPHTAARAEPGYAELRVAPEGPAEDEGQAGDDGEVPATVAQAASVAARTHERMGEASSVAVLLRRRAHIPWLLFALKRLGVNASEAGGGELGQSPAVAAVLSLVWLCDHPADAAARFHVAASPLGSALGLRLGDGGAEAAHLASRVRRDLYDRGFARVISEWLGLTRAACDRRQADALERLVGLAIAFDRRGWKRPGEFAAYARCARPQGEESRGGVRVMTIHAAKGLEFDAVILPELDAPFARRAPVFLSRRAELLGGVTRVVRTPPRALRDLDPCVREMHEAWRRGEVREELSVLYVALTRARRELRMIIAPQEQKAEEPPPGSLPASLAGVLRGALAPGSPCGAGEVLWSVGRPTP